ncbi:hypothetical protein [Pseudomonas sp. 18175]|uniref:hypothetical protein n=1 Tax=Pseudomonas sp. 18175 TaxID=3390056 RepID=UPI003D24FDAF
MATRKTNEKAPNTLAALINDVEHFNADEVHLDDKDGKIAIAGVQNNSERTLRLINIQLMSDIQSGEYDYPSTEIPVLGGAAHAAPAHYDTRKGSVSINVDRKRGLYKGHFRFTAVNIFPPKNTIEVVGDFDIDTSSTSKK